MYSSFFHSIILLFYYSKIIFILIFIGHELVHTHPKLAISWYTVACYYWTCKKYELAKKYLQKATKIDKRFIIIIDYYYNFYI